MINRFIDEGEDEVQTSFELGEPASPEEVQRVLDQIEKITADDIAQLDGEDME